MLKIPTALRPAYETVLGIWGRERGIPWSINGVKCRIDPRERHRASRFYEAVVAEFMRSRILPGMTCFDIGANIGAYVLQFAAWSAPSGKVVAFEPNPAARSVLEHHVRINKMCDRVTIVPAAVGSRPGTATLFAAGAEGMSRLAVPNKLIASQVQPVQVDVTTIDGYIERTGILPDVLFLDIEGFEFAALAGGAKLIQERRDLLIVTEMHPDVWESAGTSEESATRLLNELGLRAVPVEANQDPLRDHGAVHLVQL